MTPLNRRLLMAGLGAGLLAAPALAQRREQALDYSAPETPLDRDLLLSPTPACDDGEAEATLRQTEGPYYTPGTPRRDDLSTDGEGQALVLLGRILDTSCRPVPSAVLDVWHADSDGRYDNQGYRFRGHLFTDAAGGFRLSTIRPAGYGYASAARPPHIHVKAQGAGTRLLTTQLYFPDEDNGRDRIFRDALVVDLSQDGGLWTARYDLVLERA